MPSLAFTKAHGAGNDFLVVERDDLDRLGIVGERIPELARQICSRRFGMGADGMEVVGALETPVALARAQLWNSDGSKAEISGNGTRCVAAYLADRGGVPDRFMIDTGAGPRQLDRIRAESPEFEFRMATDPRACRVVDESLLLEVQGRRLAVTAVDVGNPQCVHRVETFDFDWRSLGAALECHPHFPDGSNVSFVKVDAAAGRRVDLHVRFWERGAGATLSSGTGCLGAAMAARHHGWVGDPVDIYAEGGCLSVDWADGIRLTGPARIVGRGEFEV